MSVGRRGPDETVRIVTESSEYAYFVYRLECIFSLDATVVSWSVYRFFIYQGELIHFQGSNSFNLPFCQPFEKLCTQKEKELAFLSDTSGSLRKHAYSNILKI